MYSTRNPRIYSYLPPNAPPTRRKSCSALLYFRWRNDFFRHKQPLYDFNTCHRCQMPPNLIFNLIVSIWILSIRTHSIFNSKGGQNHNQNGQKKHQLRHLLDSSPWRHAPTRLILLINVQPYEPFRGPASISVFFSAFLPSCLRA